MNHCGSIAVGFLLFVLGSAFGADSDIRLNSLGFLPKFEKKATVITACSEFAVKRVRDGKTVFSGKVAGPFHQDDVGQDVWVAEFSQLHNQGDYYLDVPGVGRSMDFPVGDNVYDAAYYTTMRAFYLWRCGAAVQSDHQGQTFTQAACHMQDGYQDYVGPDSSRRDGTGGWHDAGDYNKYVVNAGVTVGNLFLAWDQFHSQLQNVPLALPETAPGYPDFLKEIKWETDWLFKMVLDSGKVSHKLSALGFCGFIMPEAELEKRFFTDWSSTATADFCAMMAMAARYFKPYDPDYAKACLAAAEKSYAFLKLHPENKRPNQRAFRTGGYGASDPDDRLWAAAELWETTGHSEYLQDFETRAAVYPQKILRSWDWGDVHNLGMVTYYFSDKPGRNPEIVEDIRRDVIAIADSIVLIRDQDVYARPFDKYWWGCNGAVARQAVVLQAANRIAPNPDYLNTLLDVVGYLFGRNYYGRSFVTGLGHLPPMQPHDRRSAADGIDPPWPGYLIGGGLNATNWTDDEKDFRTNEIAINWQAALVYALAGFVSD